MEIHDIILLVLLVLILAVLAVLSYITYRIHKQRQKNIVLLTKSKEMRYLVFRSIGQYLNRPLKAIHDSCEKIEASSGMSEKERNGFIRSIHENSHMMNFFLKELDELISFDGSIPKIGTIEVNIAELVMSYRREILHEINRGVLVGIRTSMSPNCKATLDTPMFHLLMMLLLRVCAQHTKAGYISISYEWEREGLRFRIEDTGGALPDEYKGVIFKKKHPNFHALPIECRQVGISLRICKVLLDYVHGTIETYSSEEDKGIVLDFWLPCYVRFA